LEPLTPLPSSHTINEIGLLNDFFLGPMIISIALTWANFPFRLLLDLISTLLYLIKDNTLYVTLLKTCGYLLKKATFVPP